MLGRYRNTFTLKDGRIIYPYVEIGRFRDYIPFGQVQVVQTDYDALEVRYVPIHDAKADEAGLQAYLREAIDPSFNVRASPSTRSRARLRESSRISCRWCHAIVVSCDTSVKSEMARHFGGPLVKRDRYDQGPNL